MVTIREKDDPILRKIAKPVTKAMFGTPRLKKIITDMKSAMNAEDDAVAIAAPQIGHSLRIFVVSGKVFELMLAASSDTPPENTTKKSEDVVFINPEIIKISKEKNTVEEGCLSVRYLYGKTIRAKKAKVRALDEKGRQFEIGASGLLAQIFQHETDHLDGRLFIDHATDIEDLPPEKMKNRKDKRAIDRAHE